MHVGTLYLEGGPHYVDGAHAPARQQKPDDDDVTMVFREV